MCCFDTQKSNFCPNMVVAQQKATKRNKRQQKTTKTTKNNKLKNNKKHQSKKVLRTAASGGACGGPFDRGKLRLRRTPIAANSVRIHFDRANFDGANFDRAQRHSFIELPRTQTRHMRAAVMSKTFSNLNSKKYFLCNQMAKKNIKKHCFNMVFCLFFTR